MNKFSCTCSLSYTLMAICLDGLSLRMDCGCNKSIYKFPMANFAHYFFLFIKLLLATIYQLNKSSMVKFAKSNNSRFF